MTKRYYTVKDLADKIQITYPRVQYALTMQQQEPVVQVGIVKGYDNKTLEWLQDYFDLEEFLVQSFADSESSHQYKVRDIAENVRSKAMQAGINIRMTKTYQMYVSPFDYIMFTSGTCYNCHRAG